MLQNFSTEYNFFIAKVRGIVARDVRTVIAVVVGSIPILENILCKLFIFFSSYVQNCAQHTNLFFVYEISVFKQTNTLGL